jgi:hypothetical protein
LKVQLKHTITQINQIIIIVISLILKVSFQILNGEKFIELDFKDHP